MITLYGISNCDTVKQARKWLEQRRVEHRFHDFREQGIESTRVRDWIAELGWETVVNRRSSSWKQLDEATRSGMDEALALKAILNQPTLVKRPLLDTGSSRHVGFSEQSYGEIFHQHTL